MKAEALAAALVGLLEGHLPQGVQIRAEGEAVVLTDKEGVWDRIPLAMILYWEGDPTERTRTAIYAVLNRVQDFVAETIREPWPTTQGAYSREQPLPDPNVIEEAGRLRLVYGPREKPALDLGSIEAQE